MGNSPAPVLPYAGSGAIGIWPWTLVAEPLALVLPLGCRGPWDPGGILLPLSCPMYKPAHTWQDTWAILGDRAQNGYILAIHRNT